MKDFIIKASFIISGVIHLLPIAGVLGVKTIEKMYGVPVSDPDLEILLLHRAVLFGLLGTFLIFSATLLVVTINSLGVSSLLTSWLFFA